MLAEAAEAMQTITKAGKVAGGSIGVGSSSCGGSNEGNSRAADSSGAENGWLSWLLSSMKYGVLLTDES
jgi:hypothetical protein